MGIQLTEEQELLRSSTQRFLRDQYDFEQRLKIVATDEGWSRKHWAHLPNSGYVRRHFWKALAASAADRSRP